MTYPTGTATDPSGNTSEFSAAFSNPKEASPAGDMFVIKGPGTSLQAFYTQACGATNHTVFLGIGTTIPLAGLAWTSGFCSLGTTGVASFDPGDPLVGQFFYFVMVGQNASQEGSYGHSSGGAEEPEAIAVGLCDLPQSLIGTCP